MSGKKPQLVSGEIYHINLRAVGSDSVFKDENDFFRGVFSVFEYNNTKSVSILRRRQERKIEKIKEAVRGQTSYSYVERRDKFVEVLAFCFMPNHIHLLVKQLKEDGISKFMQKFGGLASYTNTKYKRKGHLFNNFKPVHIESDGQLKIVLTYIHCNPISLLYPNFKEQGVRDVGKTIEFLKNYKWSSYRDYIGIKNFHYVTNRDFLLEIMGGAEGCKAAVENWVLHKKEVNNYYFE